MGEYKRKVCSYLERVYECALEMAMERLDVEGACMSAHRYCDDGSGRTCIECNTFHVMERAKKEIENQNKNR
jgi:hypothetical protein